MPGGPGNIVITVGAHTAQAVREMGNVNKALGDTMTTGQKMQAGLKKAAVPAAAALGAIGVGAKVAINAASDLNEQINKTRTVFGPAGAQMEDWSKTLVHSFGISQEAALEASGTFGNMLVPMGFARKDAAKMSETMVQLAGDMASFNNASPEETLDALRSGLAGESEPLRKFGVFLSDARLKQEALRQGLYSGKGAMDAHAKAAATMALIMKDTSDAQGDFAKTADGAANQTRIQAAEMENLKASLGQSLLPAYKEILSIMTAVLGVMAQHQDAIKILVGVVAALSGAILAANIAMKVYQALQLAIKVATAAWTAAQWLLNAALNANPIGLVIVAVAALTAGIILAYRKSETFRQIVQGAFAAVRSSIDAVRAAFVSLLSAAASAFNWIKAHWQLALFSLGPIGAAVYVIVTNFDKLKGAAERAWSAITSGVKTVLDAINSVIDAVKSLVSWIGKIHVPHVDLPGPFGLAAAGGGGAASRGAVATAGAPVTVNVYGAIDPEGTARAILRVLNAHNRRQGAVAGGLY